jgi:acetyl esterase
MTATTRPEHGETVNFATDPRLSTGTKNFLKVLNSAGGPPLETLAPIAARKVLEGAQASVNVDVSGIAVSERMIEADGMSIKLIVVRPENANGKLPAFMFFHGGGWVLGDYPTHERIVRDLVVESGFPAVFVEYTRTPDAVFPRQVDELYAATKWVSEHGDEINVDGTRLAIVGNSVGANMTAVTAIKAIENGGPKITSIVMMWPVTDTDQETDSYQQFGQDRFLTKSLMKWMFDLYVTKPEQWNDHHVAPLKTPTEILSKFPPTLIQVGESDILLDEGEAFGRKLDAAGVEVTTIRYNGMIHDFGLLNPLANEPATRSLFRHAAAELKKRLG